MVCPALFFSFLAFHPFHGGNTKGYLLSARVLVNSPPGFAGDQGESLFPSVYGGNTRGVSSLSRIRVHNLTGWVVGTISYCAMLSSFIAAERV
jgi:hypothetical protein